MKKLLILGGAFSQIPAIKCAKEMGLYVITCDYLPENPGHKYADYYANISTVDKAKVLELARKEKVDGIIAYASDPSAPTAAFVSEKMGMSGLTSNVADMFCRKDLFRKFQSDHNLTHPDFIVIGADKEVTDISFGYPCIVKPVDMSGSRGVTVANTQTELNKAVKEALGYGRAHKVIVEEYIPTDYCQLHGDGVVQDGEVIFLGLGDQRFRNSVPIGSSLPSLLPRKYVDAAINEVKKIIRLSGFTDGCINAEVRISQDGMPYVIEIGPRTGGNYVPQLEQAAYGVNITELSLRQALGENVADVSVGEVKWTFQYIIGSDSDGIFEEVFFDDYIKQKVKIFYCHKKAGDFVCEYFNSIGVVGVAILQFTSEREMVEDIDNIHSHIYVKVRKNEK